MLELLREAARFISEKSLEDSNLSQRLYHRYSVSIFLIFITVISTGQFIGEPISCHHRSNKISDAQMNSYCYWMSNYIVVDQNELNYYLYPGVKNQFSKYNTTKVIHVAYYQYVVYYFALQAVFFYSGRFLFKNNSYNVLVNNLKLLHDQYHYFKSKKKEINEKFTSKTKSYIETYEYSKQNFSLLDGLVNSLKPLSHLKLHKTISYLFIFSEVVNIVALLAMIYATDVILYREFFNLGRNFIRNPYGSFLSVIFPRVSKCALYVFGPSGSIQNIDCLCVNSLNILYEKIFIFLWFWYVLILSVGILNLLYHIVMSILFSRSRSMIRFMLREVGCDSEIRKISRFVRYPDWIYLSFIRDNVKLAEFKFYIKLLSRDLDLSMGVKEM